MRIIDKQKDFYDFYQGIYRDDSITFDRTDSFLLTKEIMCDHLWTARAHCRWWWKGNHYPKHCILLLQVCNTFWLLLATMEDDDSYNDAKPIDYDVNIVTTWKDYNAPRKLISLDIIDFLPDISRLIMDFGYKQGWQYDVFKILSRTPDLVNAIGHKEYKVLDSINKHTIYHGDGVKTEKHIPLLKSSGIAKVVEPMDIYLSFEEFFSLEKSSNERTESVGLSNDEKVENHGFDLKRSFRGK